MTARETLRSWKIRQKEIEIRFCLCNIISAIRLSNYRPRSTSSSHDRTLLSFGYILSLLTEEIIFVERG